MRRRFAWIACVAALAVPRATHAAPFDLAGSDWEGCAELVRLARAELGSAQVVATAELNYRDLRPEDGVLILHPEKSLHVDQLARFIHAGGRVVLLDDYGRGDALLRHYEIRRVPAPRKPAEVLRGNPALALAEPADAHPAVADVQRVVTNHATGLAHDALSPVLVVRGSGEPDVLLAIAGVVDRGRLLAVADPSTVMNSMLRYAGNKAFARGLITYATAADAWGARGGRLFIVSGAFTQRGSVFGDEGPLDDVLRSARETLDTMRQDGLPGSLAHALAIAMALPLLLWVRSRAGRLHKPIVPRFVRRAPDVAHGGVAGRAAVVAAPHTSRVLAVLELKSALEEQLAVMLGLARLPAHDELFAEAARRRLLDGEGLRTLRSVLLRMAHVETMVVLQRSGGSVAPIRDAEVVALAASVRELLRAASVNTAHPAAHPGARA